MIELVKILFELELNLPDFSGEYVKYELKLFNASQTQEESQPGKTSAREIAKFSIVSNSKLRNISHTPYRIQRIKNRS